MSARMIFIRAAVIVGLPPIVLWAIVARLGSELKSACFYVRCDVLDEIASARRMWRTGTLK